MSLRRTLAIKGAFSPNPWRDTNATLGAPAITKSLERIDYETVEEACFPEANGRKGEQKD